MSQRTATLRRAASRPRLRAGVALALVLAATVVAGCGNDLPPNAVARVGDTTIEQSEFDRWLAAAARSQAAPVPGAAPTEAAVPDPPEYTECVQTRLDQAQQAVDQAQGGANVPEPQLPSEEELRQQCEQEYELLKEQVMQFLIQAEAVQHEADERGIELSEEEVQARFEDLRDQSFPNEQQFEQYLEQSGMSEEDLLYRVRLDLLISEIRDDVLAEGGEVTEEEIAEYYEAHQDEPPIGQPEQRDIRVVVTENEQQAEQARRRIEDGEPFGQVAEDLSIDPASRDRGGQLTVQQGAEEEAFDEAVFTSEPGELVGPVETELGFYVFEVTDVQEGQTQSLEEASEAITEILRTQREQEVLTEFQEQFEREAREMTTCAEDFTIPACSNGPDPEEEPDPGAAPPGAPPGAPPTEEAPPGAPPTGAPPPDAPPTGAPPAPAPDGGSQGGGQGGG